MSEGAPEGTWVGSALGLADGCLLLVGDALGFADGSSETDGCAEGRLLAVGTTEGRALSEGDEDVEGP